MSVHFGGLAALGWTPQSFAPAPAIDADDLLPRLERAWRLAPEELVYVLNDSGARIVFAGPERRRAFITAAHRACSSHEIGPSDLPPLIHHAAQAASRPPRRSERIVLDELLVTIEKEAIVRALTQAGGNKTEAARLQKRYRTHRDSLYVFLERAACPERSEWVEPTNNSSERDLRPPAIHRKVIGGFRSAWGAEASAIRTTILTTARKRCDNLLDALRAKLDRHADIQSIDAVLAVEQHGVKLQGTCPRRWLPRHDEVVVVSPRPTYHWSPSNIWVGVGLMPPSKVTIPLAPVYERTDGQDGYVSMEVDPTLAYEQDATIEEALRLHEWIDRPNLFVKIPATEPGLGAIEECIARGKSINVTLIFSLDRYAAVRPSHVNAFIRERLGEEPLQHAAKGKQLVYTDFRPRVEGFTPDLFVGRPVVITGKFSGNPNREKIRVRGRVGGSRRPGGMGSG